MKTVLLELLSFEFYLCLRYSYIYIFPISNSAIPLVNDQCILWILLACICVYFQLISAFWPSGCNPQMCYFCLPRMKR